MDGSIHVLDDRFVTLVREKLGQQELVLWGHSEDRDCFLEEARHCDDWPKYRDGPLLEQAAHYVAKGMPEHFGLWATGSIARRHTDRMRALGDSWLAEMERWTIQDQVSLPYLLWRERILPGTFGIDQLENDLVAWIPHAQEIRDHRRTILGLESEIIRLNGDLEWIRAVVQHELADHRRLRSCRAVRAALWIARRSRPVVGLLRSLRSDAHRSES
jgi:hypothetical protein